MANVIVQSLPDYAFAQLISTTGRALVADEPVEDGGNSLGPSPYELLASALGACTSMTIQLYARRKKYPLHEVAVEVEFERIHAKDCGNCAQDHPDPDARIEVFRRKIVLRGPLDEAARDDLLRVAGRCPVHRTLANGPHVVDTVEVVG